MTVRPGMTLIVAQLRQYGQASQTDIFNDETFWTDEQLQAIADTQAERLLVRILPINPATRTQFAVKTPRNYWFETDTIAVMQVTGDATLTIVDTPFVYDPNRGEFTFTEDLPCNREYAIQGYATNLWLALADLWEQKAAQRYDYADFKAGNNKINMSQEHAQCLKMSKLYRNRIVKRYSRGGTGRWA